ncbi:outer membrane protein [Neptunomonas japonica]|uniref:outer membrane protein n=1 Tax=Neptunomonas japonica TaxID=417574 RepID=UPI00040E8F90|nr:porin family protein [Neptunomonas japonica]
MNKSARILGISVATALATASLSNAAQAGDGFYLGGHIQSSTLSHSIERNTGLATSPSITSFAEESDVAIGLHLGYKYHVTDDVFVAAEVFYNDENASTTNINNMLQTKIDLQSSYGVNFKAGVDVTHKFSVYGIAGATALDFDIHNSYPFAPPMRSGSESEVGLTLGLGFEYAVNDKWSVKGEYTRINDVDFSPLPEVAVPGKINPNELDYDSMKLALSYSF